MIRTVNAGLRSDVMEVLRPILDTLSDGDEIVFEKGTYHFGREKLYRDRYAKLPIITDTITSAIKLCGKKNIRIDGGQSEFVFHGRVTPILVDCCENVKIENFTVDYDRPFYSEALVVEAGEHRVKIRFAEAFTHRMKDGLLTFSGDGWETAFNGSVVMLQEFDVKTKAPAFGKATLIAQIGSGEKSVTNDSMTVFAYRLEDAGDGDYYLYSDDAFNFDEGNVIEFCHEGRENSTFNIYGSKNVTVESVHIRHGSAFGIMASVTENLTVRKLDISLDEKSKGLVTTCADAIHAIHCFGTLLVEDCVFENMTDDGFNAHGMFLKIVEQPEKNKIRVRCKITGYCGIESYKEGTKIRVFRGNTMEQAGEYTVRSAQYLEENFGSDIILETCEEIPDGLVGSLIENYEMMPEVIIRNLRTGNNRPRGILLQTGKKVVVENCVFHNSVYAINFTSDFAYWHESGPVTDVTIRNNVFDNCCYSWGEMPIAITPEYETCEKARYCHKNINITGNTFYTFNGGMVYAFGVDGLTVRDNKLVFTDRFPRSYVPRYVIKNCDNCSLE